MPRQARSEQTRDRLIEAAYDLLSTKGTAGTTFDAIAERSGLSRGCVRFHFGSKQGLLLAVVERMFAEYEEHIATQLIGGPEGPSSIAEVLESHRDFIQRNQPIGRLFFILIFEALGPSPELLPHFVELFGRLRRTSVSWIRAAEDVGTIRPGFDAEAVASIMLGIFGGMHYQWQVDREHMDLARVYTALGDILNHGLAHEGTA